MNKHLRKFAFCLAVLLAVAGCSQAPKEVNGQPVHEVPFEQPLVLKPETGQDFYFYFKGRGKELKTNYTIGVTFLIPADDKKLMADVDKWSFVDYENKKPGKDNLHFDIKLEYHAQGKVVPVSLKNSWSGYADRQAGSQWYRLWSQGYAISGTDKIIDGRRLVPFLKGVAKFMPADVSDQPDGFYKLSIRPAVGVRYPNIQFETFVKHESHK